MIKILFFKQRGQFYRVHTKISKHCITGDSLEVFYCPNSKNYGWIGCQGCLMNAFDHDKSNKLISELEKIEVPLSTLFLFKEEEI